MGKCRGQDTGETGRSRAIQVAEGVKKAAEGQETRGRLLGGTEVTV